MDGSAKTTAPNGRRTGIVLLHAFPLNARMWEAQLDSLGDYLTLAPDFPGFGSRPPGPEELDGFADIVRDALDGADIDRAVLVGLSMGGYVAFRFADRWPERVAGLVLADTRAGPDSDEGRLKRTALAERARSQGTEWLADEMITGLLGATTRDDRPGVVELVRGMIDEADAEGVARALLAMRDRPDSFPMLDQLAVPSLVIVGEEDTLTGVEEAEAIQGEIPSADLVAIPGAGHLSNLENPEAFNEALSRFLVRHAARFSS